MIAQVQLKNKIVSIHLNQGINISNDLKTENSVRAWYVDYLKISPVKNNDFIGEVKQGAPVNFKNVFFNPHAHGTHTECYGHITKENVFLPDVFKGGFFESELITVKPELIGEDSVIDESVIKEKLKNITLVDCLIIRTLPNKKTKKEYNFSDTNPPYISKKAMQLIVERGVKHLIIDLPSVDKEQDDGKLVAHREFWNFDGDIRKNATITELVYIPDTLEDGAYLTSITFPKFFNDACPSSIILYKPLN